MDCIVCEVTKNRTWLSTFHFHFGLPWRLSCKNLPAMQETWVRSLVWEDPLEKGMALHSSVLAWRIPWTFPWDSRVWREGANFTPFTSFLLMVKAVCSRLQYCWPPLRSGLVSLPLWRHRARGSFWSVLYLVFCLQLMDWVAKDEKA